MAHSIQEHLLCASNSGATSLPIMQLDPVAKTGPLHYPLQPTHPTGSFYSCLPSDRYKNIFAYYYQGYLIKGAPERTIYPTGNAALVFRCSDQKPGAFLVGTPTIPCEPEYVIRGCDYFVAWFWPGMSYAFYPLPAKELTDRFLSLDELLGVESERIKELMSLAKTFQERVRIFEWFMDYSGCQLREIPKKLTSIIAIICREARQSDEEKLEIRTHYTDRHIRRLFQTYVGISPYLFKRIMRHQFTLKVLSVRPNQGMAELAMEYGHYDQSHLIKEFKTFLGLTPTQFISKLSRRKDQNA